MPYSQRTSVLFLSLIEFLERFSFYGTRVIILLFATDENGLGLQRSDALSNYAYLITLLFILPLPAGIISDFTIKQKNGILLGGIVALAGYTFLIMEEMNFIIIGLILMAIGTSFVRTNLTVLIGRLYEKTDKNRGFGFMIFYFALNLGAFLGILVTGIISEEHGWKYGFMISTFVTLLYVILFYFIKDQLPLIEKNINQHYLETNSLDDTISDSELIKNKKSPKYASIILIIILMIINSLFWNFHEVGNDTLFAFLRIQEGFKILGYDIPVLLLSSFTAGFNLILMLLLCIIWYSQGIGSTIGKIASSIILLGISMQLVYYIITFSDSNYASYAFLSLFIFSVAEVLIAPFIISYITRLSDVRYSSTIFGSYILFSGITSSFLSSYVDIFESNYYIIAFSIMAILIGLVLLFFKRRILKMSNGLD